MTVGAPRSIRGSLGVMAAVVAVALGGFLAWSAISGDPVDGSMVDGSTSAAPGPAGDDGVETGRGTPGAEGETAAGSGESVPAAGSAPAGPSIRPLPPAGGIPEVEPEGPRPVGLSIPELAIGDSAVRPVGVEPSGEYEVPIASEVGWYRFGSAPGEDGSTVMAAHIAYDGQDGVFRYLSTVEPGAAVEIELDDGTTRAYEIVELATYDKQALPFDEIFSERGPDRLVLITCGGSFNPALRSYESNVVAYAEARE